MSVRESKNLKKTQTTQPIMAKGRYVNNVPREGNFWGIIVWLMKTIFYQRKQKTSLTISKQKMNNSDNSIYRLGHACILININGFKIITDPHFHDIPFTKRMIDFPLSVKEIGEIDYILISHDHSDHLHLRSLSDILKYSPNATVLSPLGIGSLVAKLTANFQEVSWHENFNTVDGLKIQCVPAHHYSRRGLFDKNKRLCGGFVIKNKAHSIYYTGDTSNENNFQEIAKLYGPFDTTFIPIAPTNFPQNHITPDEAVGIIPELQTKVMIPIHYGTYNQSDENINTAINMFKNAIQKNNQESKTRIVQILEQIKL